MPSKDTSPKESATKEKFLLPENEFFHQAQITHLEAQVTLLKGQLAQEKRLRQVAEEKASQFEGLLENLPLMSWSALASGYEDFHNGLMQQYTGPTATQAKGKGWRGLIHPDDLALTLRLWRSSLNSGAPYQAKYRLRRHDGVYHWFMSRALPLRNQQGKIIRWFGVNLEIHQEEENRQALASSNQELSRINQVLDSFVYMAAHDLQSPVRNLKSLIALHGLETNEGQKQELERMISYSVDRLNYTVSGLLGFPPKIIEGEKRLGSHLILTLVFKLFRAHVAQ